MLVSPRRLLFVLLLAACDLPRDTAGTTDRVRNGTIRIGVVQRAPWAFDSAGTVGGVDVALVTQVARDLHARPVWIRGSAPELLAALERRELDAVIGGLTSDIPYAGKVALTRPFYTDTLVVGAPSGSPAGIEGYPVAVEAGSSIAADVRAAGGRPVPMPTIDSADGLVAASVWKLGALHRVSSGVVLRQEPRVIALPSGENELLVRLERALFAARDEIPTMLRSRGS